MSARLAHATVVFATIFLMEGCLAGDGEAGGLSTGGGSPTGGNHAGPDDEDEPATPLSPASPELQTPEGELAAALSCPADLAEALEDPVILVPGTRLSPETNFGWNWKPALEAAGIPVCLVALHDQGLADVQRTVENVVYAIRDVHARSGRPVRLIGYSQGAVVPRWALRFWPDLRPMVSEIVTLAGVHNGTTSTDASCSLGCAPALYQLRPGTQFIEALNATSTTYPDIDITSIYSRYDELATPNVNGEASSLAGAANIALQDLCPANVAEHVTIGTTDPVAYALALDALTHTGPAVPSRIPINVCTKTLLPGVDPLTMSLHVSALWAEATDSMIDEPRVTSEPPLRCYVTGTCDE